MKLENLNLVELDAQDLMVFEGGGRGRVIVKYGRKFLEWAGVFDAVDSFVEGWNSVPTEC